MSLFMRVGLNKKNYQVLLEKAGTHLHRYPQLLISRLAQRAACPHQRIFSKFYPQSVYVVFRDIRDKNAVNQGFWSKTTVFIRLEN